MINLTLFERRLRITTGLILAVYIIVHLTNHLLGLVSLDIMESTRVWVSSFWRSWIGGTLLYGSLLVHFSLALVSLYRRTTLRMPTWELAQLILGLSIIPLLAGHMAATWGSRVLMDVEVDYEFVLGGILNSPWLITRQTLLILVAWSHVVIGLHFFFRLFSWYRRSTYYIYPLAVLIPLLVIFATLRVGFDLDIWQQSTTGSAYSDSDGYGGGYTSGYGYGGDYGSDYGSNYTSSVATTYDRDWLRNWILITFYCLLLITLAARFLRNKVKRGKDFLCIKHPQGSELKGVTGQTILEIIRSHAIPHASVCGGRGRCTTCRVRIGEGFDQLPAPGALELAALDRIGAAPNVRLACQTRPVNDIHITPLLPPDLKLDQDLKEGGVSGEEREVLAMFVDLRGSTKMGEQRMPYDVLFILNRFFLEMSHALKGSHGHYAQFAGDGLMALYGLERGLKQGCIDALQGAVEMQKRINRLNENLKNELSEPLEIGIGIHCGEAIVGTMGPPSSPNYSAIGDNINAAARLEGQTKELNCTLVVSHSVVRCAGLDFSEFSIKTVNVRGKQQSLQVYAIDDPLEVATYLPTNEKVND